MAAFWHERRLCAPHFFAWIKRLREAATPRQPQGGEAAPFVEVKLIDRSLRDSRVSRATCRATANLRTYARVTRRVASENRDVDRCRSHFDGEPELAKITRQRQPAKTQRSGALLLRGHTTILKRFELR